MKKISQKQQKIIGLFIEKGALSSSAVYDLIRQSGEVISLVTVKRALAELLADGFLVQQGTGRATVYEVATSGRIFAEINAHDYSLVEPDKRYGFSNFRLDLFSSLPDGLFLDDEINFLENASTEYIRRTNDLSPVIRKKELERLIIELSWKSSKIEGNTYTLLDTEKLLLNNIEAVGHDKSEAVMILNHKHAFTFLYENSGLFKELNRANLEKLHALLVDGLDVETGLRKRPVGVVGSKYRPLDNPHQIIQAFEALALAVNKMKSPYDKAMFALLGISYLQPFEDGNKRTSRLMANALLLAHGCAPLSYRSVDESEYREAVLVFYELQSVVPFKRIFVEQYDFAARNYAVMVQKDG